MIVSELVALLGFRVNNSGAQQFDKTLNRLSGVANGIAAGIAASFTNTFTNMAASLGSAIASIPGTVAQAGDAMVGSLAKIESSIGRSGTSAAEAAGLYDQLYELGTRTGVAADESANAFTRFNIAMQNTGRPAADTIKLIEGIQSAAIIAGVTTQELTGAMIQLGQGLGSGKLQGDELKSLREAMPRFLGEITKELGITSEQFFDEATKGLLTPARLIPAMLKASEGARAELANFPLTMGRSFAILTNSATRFMAELDKQLGLSKTLAQVFSTISTTLDSWRNGLSIVGDMVRELGGLEGVARLVGAAMLVAFGPVVLRAVWGLVGAINVFGAALLRAFLPLVGAAAWVLIIEDFFVWMQGGKSLFGERFGDFNTVFAGVTEGLQTIRDEFNRLVDVNAVFDAVSTSFQSLRDEINRLVDVNAIFESVATAGIFFKDVLIALFHLLVEDIKRFGADASEMAASVVRAFENLRTIIAGFFSGVTTGFNWFHGLPATIMAAFNPLVSFFESLLGSISRRFEGFRETVMGVVNSVRNAVGSMLGSNEGAARTSGLGIPAEQSSAIQNFLNATPPDVSGRLATPGAGSVNQTNTITNEVTVNAPGADPASVAAGTRAGTDRATNDMMNRLDGFARSLGVANPRIEAPAQ